MSDKQAEIINQCREKLHILNAKKEQLQKDNTRLLVLATKHCPIEHHDFDEIKKIAKLIGSF